MSTFARPPPSCPSKMCLPLDTWSLELVPPPPPIFFILSLHSRPSPFSPISVLSSKIKLETDLKEKLFNTQVPFRKGGDNGAIDVDLMTDCLVSSFRIGPRKALGSLFPECVHADAPPHFKMVLVKGLLRIAKEGTRQQFLSFSRRLLFSSLPCVIGHNASTSLLPFCTYANYRQIWGKSAMEPLYFRRVCVTSWTS